MIQEVTFEFLRKLEANNNREWFLENKNEYEISKANFVGFCSEVLDKLKEIEPSFGNTQIKDCIFRINRDIRFAKDKRPYKNNLSAGFGAGGRNSGKIDYYFQLQNGETLLGAGMWQPTTTNLAKFRQELDYNPEILKSIIKSKEFMESFPLISGEKLKRPPKGYDENHPEIELLKYKELFFIKKFSNQEVKANNFSEILFDNMKIIKPYIDYLNELFYGENE